MKRPLDETEEVRLRDSVREMLDLLPMFPEEWTPEVTERCESMVGSFERDAVARAVVREGRALERRYEAFAAINVLELQEFDDVLVFVITNARHRDAFMRQRAYTSLLSSRRPEAGAILSAGALLDSDYTNRGDCVEILADAGRESDLERLLPALLRTETSSYVLFQAAQAIWLTDTRIGLDALRDAAARSESSHRLGLDSLLGALFVRSGELPYLVRLVNNWIEEDENWARVTLWRLDRFFDPDALRRDPAFPLLREALATATRTPKCDFFEKPNLAALAADA